MGSLELETQRLLAASMASNTHATYKRGVESFDSFRSKLGLDIKWPAPIDHIIAYIASLSIECKSPSTINTYISALAYIHKLNGWQDPTDNFIIKKLKEGCKRQDKRSDCRRPITLPILRQLSQLLQGLCQSTFESSLFRAAFLLAFFGFLRVGEFTVTSKNGDVSNILSRGDIIINHGPPEFMEATIRFSKTDQYGESTTLNFTRGTDPLLCPVNAMIDYLRVRPSTEGPLFIHFGKDPMTRYQFDSMLKRGIKAMGLCPTLFSPHSFRIGAATSAAVSGIPMDIIKSIGRWQSSAVKLYVRPHMILPLP